MDSVTLLNGDTRMELEYLAVLKENMIKLLRGKWLPGEKNKVLVIPIVFYQKDYDKPTQTYLINMPPIVQNEFLNKASAIECIFVSPVYVKGNSTPRY